MFQGNFVNDDPQINNILQLYPFEQINWI